MSELNLLFSDDVANAIQRLYKNQYDDMTDNNGCYIGYIKKEYDIFIIQENLKRLSCYEALEKLSREQTGMQLNELVKQYQLLDKAFREAYCKLTEYDKKSCYDGIKTSDVWKYILIKKAEEQMEELKNEKSK